jgi:hypothetical protein
VIRTWAIDNEGNTRKIRTRIAGEKSREGFNLENIRKHLERAIAIAAPLSAAIPAKWSLKICSFAE